MPAEVTGSQKMGNPPHKTKVKREKIWPLAASPEIGAEVFALFALPMLCHPWLRRLTAGLGPPGRRSKSKCWGGALRQTARAWPKAAWRVMRSARPAPSAALVSRALVCGACAGVRLRSPFGSALARGQSRGQSVNRQSAHRPALYRRAARAIILFTRRKPAQAPIGFACQLRCKGRACALFFGAPGWLGRSARGPSASSAQERGASPNPVGRCGRRLQPVAFFFLLSSHLAFFLAIALLFFPHFFLRNAPKPENKTRPVALCAPLFFFGVSSFRRPDPGKQKKRRDPQGTLRLGQIRLDPRARAIRRADSASQQIELVDARLPFLGVLAFFPQLNLQSQVVLRVRVGHGLVEADDIFAVQLE